MCTYCAIVQWCLTFCWSCHEEYKCLLTHAKNPLQNICHTHLEELAATIASATSTIDKFKLRVFQKTRPNKLKVTLGKFLLSKRSTFSAFTQYV